MLNFLKSLYNLWRRLGKFLTRIIAWVVLFFFYFLVIGLFSIFIRLILRRDFLNKRFADAPTFWIDREKIDMNLQNCRQQF